MQCFNKHIFFFFSGKTGFNFGEDHCSNNAFWGSSIFFLKLSNADLRQGNLQGFFFLASEIFISNDYIQMGTHQHALTSVIMECISSCLNRFQCTIHFIVLFMKNPICTNAPLFHYL